MFKPADLFDLAETAHAAIFADCQYAWGALKKIESYIAANLKPELRNKCEGVAYVGEKVFIGEGTVVEDGVMIKGPAIIGCHCRIRHNAYIRENVIIGDNCIVGNSTEIKNSLLFNHTAAPHFNYIGDSILGHGVHLGAGVKISNFKLFPGNIAVETDGKPLDTGLRKFGALLGDGAEVGCNAVLNPGSIVGRGAVIYPNVFWRGVLAARTIAKNKATVELVPMDAPEAENELLTKSKSEKDSSAITSNFTPRAQEALILARKEADRFNHNYLGAEHVLLGLIELGSGVAANVLVKLGLNLESVRAEVEKQTGTVPGQKVIGNIPYTPRVKKVLDFARREAKVLNHTYIGTEHLLLGLLRENGGLSAEIFKKFKIKTEELRKGILHELDPNSHNAQKD